MVALFGGFDPYGFDTEFRMISGIGTLIFLLVLGLFIFLIVRAIGEWSHNNSQPVVPVFSTVVAKRAAVSHHHTAAGDSMHMHHHSTTTYFVTFQFENGHRLELRVPDQEFGMLVEGDRGTLSFQGTRYLSFQRETHFMDV